ncbi:hypothetical protein C8A03DRAFT_29342 [Achaetomium macrosporum]|uniref:BRCT domain-containing protein n=1 Tax=Achaetomium macrosporum TaxID=79813 RepID=A0AAN7CIT2_9PEZI|nr:hypothetical protein C8A03DRAFT_29342 [Achaetomium macrosporum]
MGTRKEKPIFRGLTIAAAGYLGGGQWTDTAISRWVGLREGKFVREMSEDVTHLVGLEDEFWRMGKMVKAALKRPKTCQVVTLDWLEDSMLKGKRLDEKPYSHLEVLKRERQRERKRMLVVKGLEKAVREANPSFYHIYCDHTFFRYEVVLTKDDESAGIQGQRYILTLHESNNTQPYLYWFVARFYKEKGDTQAKIYRPSHAPGVFAREFALFESFFHKKTGVPWEERLMKAGTTDKSFFQYQLPVSVLASEEVDERQQAYFNMNVQTGGKPVGWVPAEYIPGEIPNQTPAAEWHISITVTTGTGTSQPEVTLAGAVSDPDPETHHAGDIRNRGAGGYDVAPLHVALKCVDAMGWTWTGTEFVPKDPGAPVGLDKSDGNGETHKETPTSDALTDAATPQPQVQPAITPAPSPDAWLITPTSSPPHGQVEGTISSVAASALAQLTPGPSPQVIDLTGTD